MNSTVTDFIDRTRQVRDIGELEMQLSMALEMLGFWKWAYLVVRSDVTRAEEPVLLSTYPVEWTSHYFGSNYHLIDPVVQKGPEQLMPFVWSDLIFGDELSPEQRRLFAEADEYGVREGLGIPVYGARGALSIMSMASEEGTDQLAQRLPEVGNDALLISLVFHNMIRELPGWRLIEKPHAVTLTPRENECLLWIAKGKTSGEIATILGISERTVNFHADNARAKYGTSSRYEAVIKAVMAGAIEL